MRDVGEEVTLLLPAPKTICARSVRADNHLQAALSIFCSSSFLAIVKYESITPLVRPDPPRIQSLARLCHAILDRYCSSVCQSDDRKTVPVRSMARTRSSHYRNLILPASDARR